MVVTPVSEPAPVGSGSPGAAEPAVTPVVEAQNLRAGYGPIEIIHGIDLFLRRGEIVLLLGPNGAGKTTTLLTLSGELRALGGAVAFGGDRTPRSLAERARRGLGFVTEDRAMLSELTVKENLRVARGDADLATNLFPELRKRWNTKAGVLSGGEQQMLSLARALSRNPAVLFADELSLGLGPIIVSRLFHALREKADNGLSVLLVEQHVRQAMPIADRVYVMRQGRIAWAASAKEAASQMDEIEATYLSAVPANDTPE